MADYTPPVGSAALHLRGTPSAAALHLGAVESEISLQIAARAGARGGIRISNSQNRVRARAASPRGRLSIAYDPNLLSATHRFAGSAWQFARSQGMPVTERGQDARFTPLADAPAWRDSPRISREMTERWQPAPGLATAKGGAWKDSLRLDSTIRSGWDSAPRLTCEARAAYQDGRRGEAVTASRFYVRLPLLAPDWRIGWPSGILLARAWISREGDGAELIRCEIEVWQQAGYPGNAPNPGPPGPKPPDPDWGNNLHLVCPLPGTALHLSRVPCILVAVREVEKRKAYMILNSASLVRWPDLVPLPCTSMTIETDFESWCWGLSATLAGPDAWGLVQPAPLACQVLATVNGQQWKFLLDIPSANRAFNSDRVSLKGRSRSAWLHSPYAAVVSAAEANVREIQQLAETALENTGWTLVWNLENWLVPGGHYHRLGTPIEALLQLVGATDDGLYTDPTSEILTAQKRWPVASWLLDAAIADLSIPADALVTLSQSPVYTPPLNGAWVAGTTHGALAHVKIAGTDGALAPAEPLIHELLCDSSGVGARQRGLNALSDSGAGFTMEAETFFTPEIGLVRPGMIVSIAGMKGISRSVRILAQRSGSELVVRQHIGLERREVEA